MNNNKVTASVTFPIPTILTIIFVVLKLCKVISWSWIWVLSPLWIYAALGILLVIVAIVFATIKSKH